MPGGLPRVRPGIAVTRPACGHKPGAADTRDTDTGQGREERPNIRKHRKSENKILDNLQTFYVEMCVNLPLRCLDAGPVPGVGDVCRVPGAVNSRETRERRERREPRAPPPAPSHQPLPAPRASHAARTDGVTSGTASSPSTQPGDMSH